MWEGDIFSMPKPARNQQKSTSPDFQLTKKHAANKILKIH